MPAPPRELFWKGLVCRFIKGHIWGYDPLKLNRMCGRCGRHEVEIYHGPTWGRYEV
jgi:hypothetical protein